MKVEDLLNPDQNQTDSQELRSGSASAPQQQTQQTAYSPAMSYISRLTAQTTINSPTLPSKSRNQKVAKDAPIFRKVPTKGEVLYPPHEADDDQELAERYMDFKLFPMGEIADHCNTIPYSSDKKNFTANTGRALFEVFQYTFKISGDDKEYTVMWDYNVGLVRITPFFKCGKYSKTTPAKVLNINPGLRDISYSVTGGALAAQGYWFPYECAKAVAETFCYKVRFALAPLFGRDFVDSCLPPGHPNFGNFKIDPKIIEHCAAKTRTWKAKYGSDAACMTPLTSREPSEAPRTSHSTTGSILLKQFKKLRPKLTRKYASPESGYGTDTDWSVALASSPQASPTSSTWTSVNCTSIVHKNGAQATQEILGHASSSSVGAAAPVKLYTPREIICAEGLLQLSRKGVVHQGLVPSPSNEPYDLIHPCSTKNQTSNVSQAKRPTADWTPAEPGETYVEYCEQVRACGERTHWQTGEAKFKINGKYNQVEKCWVSESIECVRSKRARFSSV